MTACLAATPPLAGQEAARQSAYDARSGLITPALEPGSNVQIVTTETVPGKRCTAIKGAAGQFPVMAAPSAVGLLSGKNLAGVVLPTMDTVRKEALKAGANAVLAMRATPFITRSGSPRIFVYGTLARCE